MMKFKMPLTCLMAAFLLTASGQTTDSLPPGLHAINADALPFIKQIYARFPKRMCVTRSRQVGHYYCASSDSRLLATITEGELAHWKSMLDNMPAFHKDISCLDSAGERRLYYNIRLKSHFNTDNLRFQYDSRHSAFEMYYVCDDSQSESSNLSEQARLRLDSMVQHFLKGRDVEAYDYLFWGQKQVNIQNCSIPQEENATTGRRYVVHGCTGRDYDFFIGRLEQAVMHDSLEYLRLLDDEGNPMFASSFCCIDKHWITFVGLLKGTDLHLCLFGGVRPKNTIVPFDCFSGLDDIGKVNLKKGQRVEGMYDAGRVGMLPVWRGASGGTLADYLKPFGLRPCTFRDGDCVAVMFTVEMDGSITDAKIAVDKSTHAGLAAEALAVVRQMPKWSPAMADGLPVACRYVVRLTK